MKRLIFASLAAGAGMFLWSAIAHMALPLGEAGVAGLPNEDAVTAALHSGIGAQTGMYIFPDPGQGSNSDKMARYATKVATMPQGVLIYHPPGNPTSTGQQMGTEFALEWLESLIALALLAASGVQSYSKRVGFVLGIGAVAALTTNISYWNWYGFPATYTIAYMTTQLVGFLVAGLIGAKLLQASRSAYSAAA